MLKTRLGVCYYPEHWPQDMWAEDARRMAGLGLSHVRIGEFAWSRIEPARDTFQWDWLDTAVETLAAAGLKIIACTPTATPPAWLLKDMPDMVAIDRDGDYFEVLDVLAQDVGVEGVFSDWPATVTYYANCMGL